MTRMNRLWVGFGGLTMLAVLACGGCSAGEDKALTQTKTFIQRGGDPNKMDRRGITPVQGAIAKNYPKVLVYLLDNGGLADAPNLHGLTPLHAAAIFERPAMAKLLLDRGANPNVRSHKFGHSPLHIAAKKGNLELVKLLVIHNADVNAQGDRDDTPLTLAAANNRLAVAKYLLQHGAKVNVLVASPHPTPLQAAQFAKHGRMVKLLERQK